MERYHLYKQKKDILVAQGDEAKQEEVNMLIDMCRTFVSDLQTDVLTTQLSMNSDCAAEVVLTWIEELKELIK